MHYWYNKSFRKSARKHLLFENSIPFCIMFSPTGEEILVAPDLAAMSVNNSGNSCLWPEFMEEKQEICLISYAEIQSYHQLLSVSASFSIKRLLLLLAERRVHWHPTVLLQSEAELWDIQYDESMIVRTSVPPELRRRSITLPEGKAD